MKINIAIDNLVACYLLIALMLSNCIWAVVFYKMNGG